MVQSRPARWTLSAALVLAALRCPHPVVRGTLLLVSLHIAAVRAPALGTSTRLARRFPTQVARVAYCTWLHDLDGPRELEAVGEPLAVLRQAGSLRLKWLSHTLFEGLVATAGLVMLAVGLRRGAGYAMLAGLGHGDGGPGATAAVTIAAGPANTTTDAADAAAVADTASVVAAVLGTAVVGAVLVVLDAGYRFAMLLTPLNPRLPPAMMAAPWRARSPRELWGRRWAAPLGREYGTVGRELAARTGLPQSAGPVLAFAVAAVGWGWPLVAAGAPVDAGVALGVFLLVHGVAAAVERGSGLAGGPVMLWSTVALTVPLLAHAFVPALRGALALAAGGQ